MSRLRRWFHIVSRRRGRLAAACLAGFALALFGSQLLPKAYEAGAVISVHPSSGSTPVAFEPGAELETLVQAPSRFLLGEITASNFLSEVLKHRPRLGLHFAREGQGQTDPERLRRGVGVKSRGEGRFEIAYRSRDATLACELANAITADFVQAVLERRRSQYDRQLGPLEQKREKLQETLREKKERIAAFRSHNRDLLVPQEAIEQQIAEQETVLRRLAEQMEVESRQLEAVQAKLAGTPKTVESQRSTEPDPKYRMLQSELEVLKLQRDQLLVRYTEKHPSVKTLVGQIEETEQQLAMLEEATRASVVESINPLYQLLQQRRTEQELALEQIRAQTESERKVLAELQRTRGSRAQVEQEYRRLTEECSEIEREQEVVLAQIRSLQDKWAASEEPVRVLAWARLPSEPLGPGWAVLFSASLGLGLLFGLGMVSLAEGLDRSLRTVEQARDVLNLPVLGVIPVFETKEE